MNINRLLEPPQNGLNKHSSYIGTSDFMIGLKRFLLNIDKWENIIMTVHMGAFNFIT